MQQRLVMHSLATATGTVFALRMADGHPLSLVAWYFGSFVGFHIAAVPFVAIWVTLKHRVERWIRGIIEEELIRFDLQSYGRQLRRILPPENKNQP